MGVENETYYLFEMVSSLWRVKANREQCHEHRTVVFSAPRARTSVLLFLALLLPALAGCASPAPYAPLSDRFGYAGYGYYGYHGGYYFRYRSYAGADESVPITRYEVIAEIVVGGPGLSDKKADVYTAKEVIENLGPKIVLPKSRVSAALTSQRL